ncbi:hypothetical protein ABG768_016710 [Culter alburnus]|uniref:Uncharacterized protein n=1 Tax=Culter alburnus TaxID=194366 RepID=A0AAW1YZX9_CULAL
MSCDKSSINNCYGVGRFQVVKLQSDDCSKVKCCAPVHKNPCSCETRCGRKADCSCVSCCGRKAVVIQDDCKRSGACGRQVCGCFKPVCQHQDECRRTCGNEVSVSFPVNKWKGVCCTPVCDQLPLPLTDRKL